VLKVTLLGAVIGGVAGYLFFTEPGRRLRRQFEPAIDDITRELNSLRTTVRKATAAAGDGWNLLNEALGDVDTPPRHGQPRQTSPF
jgi:hypothetical protein